MPAPSNIAWDLWLGPAPVRPFHATYLPGPRWYRWWDFGNGTMSDLGSHDNDVPFAVLDLWQPDGKGGRVLAPLTIEAQSPNGPVAHKELAPATLKVNFEFAAVGSQPALRLVWHQGDSKPPGWVPEWGRRSSLFIGDKGMLLGNGEAAARGEVQGLRDSTRDAAPFARTLGRVGELRQGKRSRPRFELPVLTPVGRPKRTASATWPTARGRRSSGTTRTCAPRTRGNLPPLSSGPCIARAGTTS